MVWIYMKNLLIIFLLFPSLLFCQVSPAKIVRIADASTAFGSGLSYGTLLVVVSSNKHYKIINLSGIAGTAKFSDLVMGTDCIEVGTVTSVSTVAANNGVTATWSMASTTPALTIGLSDITPTSVNGLTLTALATGFTVTGGITSKTLTVPLDATVSGTNTGDQTNITGSAANFTGSLLGDVSGTQTATSVDKIKGVDLGTTTASDKNILIANGSTWETKAMSGDVTIGNTGVTAIGANKITLGMNTALAANSVIGNLTGSAATPTAVPMVTNSTASSIALRDASANISTNNFIQGYTTTPTVAGTTALTVGDKYQQYFTGATTQTVILPDVTTLVLGQQFSITNLSSGIVTINSFGNNLVQSLAGSSNCVVTCVLITGTSAASWSVSYVTIASVGGILPLTNGGSNANLTAANGGVVWSDATKMQITPAGTQGQVLQSNVAAAPTWVTYNLSATLAAAAATSGTGETLLHKLLIPANQVTTAGSTFRVQMYGVSSSTGTLIFRVRVGANGTTGDNQAWISTTTAAQAANTWSGVEVLVTLRSATTVQAGGCATATAVVVRQLAGAAATAAIVSSADWYIDIDVTCSVGTFTAHTATIELIK